MSDRTPVYFFDLTGPELELANIFINDGWQGDMHTLIECVKNLTESFEREDNNVL
jgi:hypothetical protein